MNATLRAFVVLLAVVMFSAKAWTGTSGKIAGEVKDSQTGEPIVGASVVVQGTNIGAATNLDGYFVILNVPPGKYTLVSSSVGYNKLTVSGVAVSVDLTTTQNFQLVNDAVEQEEVVVTAERPIVKRDLTSSESRVDASTIESLPVSEISEVLSLQAGITQDRDGGIHIRGGRTSEVAYWVDGVSVSDAYDNSQAVQVDNNSVQELQVISGTFNAEYGQAMSGIVNIVTKDGDQRFAGGLSAYSGDYITADDGIFFNSTDVKPTANHNIEGSLSGPLAGFATFYLSGRYFRSNGWLYANEIVNPDGTPLPGNSATFDAAGNLVSRTFVDRPTPMNGRLRRSGQAKLTFHLSGGTKFSLSAIGSQIDYRDYNHDYTLIPSADVKKFDKNYNVTALWTQTVSSSAFYTLNLYYLYKQFREFLYPNPLDPRYLVDFDVINAVNSGNYKFRLMGTNNHHFKRNTETRGGKIDYTDQVSKLHQLKAGLEGKLHRLYLEDYSVTRGEDAQGNSIPAIPTITGPNYEEYTEQPMEFAAYIQDKLEYENMVVNVGVRFDYFNPRGNVLTDPQDPNVYLPQKEENKNLTLEQRLAKWYKKASAKTSISPRFGISYPITDRGILHFSYGHFLQFPSFSDLFQKPGFKVTTANGTQGVFGNANLKSQKTVMYEFGMQQQLTDDLSFDLTGFYRDTRDWTSTSAQIPVIDPTGETATVFYTQFINKDYANSRGLTLSVNKRPMSLFSFNFSYTFQSAEGVNSGKDEEQARLSSNDQGTVVSGVTLAPLDWDQAHTANLTLGLGKEDWGAFVIAQYGSGLPYTPVLNQADARGSDAINTKNTRRLPANYTVDLRVFKNFWFDPINVNLFVKVFNLFDRRNEVRVYGETGRATATPEALGASLSTAIRVNTLEEYLQRPDYYSEPRQIQVGLEVNF